MAPLRIGIIGSGAIAQVHHLPNLAILKDLFSVEMLCDLSPQLAQTVAEEYHVPRHTGDWRELLAADLDAVILCHTDPKTEIAVAAFAEGKHVFIEKPICFSLQEADKIIAAQQAAGTVGQAGYMKVYDPAFEAAECEAQSMGPIRFVQIHHLHTNNSHHLAHFRLHRSDPADLPAAEVEKTRAAREAAIREAIGEVPDDIKSAFGHLSGSMIHDLYGLRHLMGVPEKIVSTEIWYDGWGISTILAYAGGARCSATWVELKDVRDFKETLEVCGDDRRILLSYPTGFSRGILSTLELQTLDSTGEAITQRPAIAWESAFVRELRHFHTCITENKTPRTPLDEARHDIALVIDIIKAYLNR
ncbi:MAG: Gfo/Idh/MocA family oxidoreductase [Candidatus Latescibacterota bacterium]|jgi:predicted dehydrogenase|nr:Gfo/Idh/MocA family oxidoreductase [Candidatus Latescibacterota bacterium]